MNKSTLLTAVYMAFFTLVFISPPVSSATSKWTGGATTTGSDPHGNTWEWFEISNFWEMDLTGATTFSSPGFDVKLIELTFDSGTLIPEILLLSFSVNGSMIPWTATLFKADSIRFEAPAGEMLSAGDSLIMQVEGFTSIENPFSACWSDGEACSVKQCNDGLDNDGDTLIDFPDDPGCTDALDDDDEVNPPQCSDLIDNDGDTLVDLADGGCTDALDDDEAGPFQCSDTLDNDGDTLIDFPDDHSCSSATDDDELFPQQCSDNFDNDGDTLTDFPTDGGCNDPTDDSEVGSGSGGGGGGNVLSSPLVSPAMLSLMALLLIFAGGWIGRKKLGLFK